MLSTSLTADPIKRIPYQHCPLCESRDFTEIRRGSCSAHELYRPELSAEIIWCSCSDCHHIFTDGYFSDADFAAAQPSQIPGYDVERGRHVAADMIEWMTRETAKRSGHWLDVGFGAGHLLTTANEYGFDVYGIDAKREAVEPLKALGYNVEQTSAIEAEPHSLSIISMMDVLEHMPYPGLALRSARQALRADGVLVLSMPNAGSFVWRALDIGKQNPYWNELEHYHNFTRVRLYALLREHGFEPFAYRASRRYRACMEVLARPAG